MKPSTILYAAAAFVVAYIILAPYLPTTFEPCILGQNVGAYCEGTKQVNRPYCHEGGYVSNNRSNCGEDECFFGQCLPTTCTQSERICSGNFSYIDRTCMNGQYTNSLSFCPSGQVCQGGYCRSGQVNGILSSWDTLYQEVQANPELKDYTSCAGVFDCNSPLIKSMAQDIMTKYSVKNPREFVDATATEVYEFISYRLSGGDEQCNEKASELVQKKITNGVVYGNCVDYSALQVSILRSQGLVSRQSGGCLTGKFSCMALSITPPLLERYGNMNGDQVLAHSFTEVYLGSEVGWIISDPTLGTSVSKCSGYSVISPGSSNSGTEMCFLPIGDYPRCNWNPN